MAANKTVGNIPLGEKMNLTVAEAAVYTGIGQGALRKMLKEPGCKFLLKASAHKLLIRRKQLEDFLSKKNDFSK